MDADGRIETKDINAAEAALRSGRCTSLRCVFYFHAGWGPAEIARLAAAIEAGAAPNLATLDLTGNHIGEYCEDSCGDFGQVNRGGACVCSGNRTGTFCELDALGQIVDWTPYRDDSGLEAGWILLIVLGTCCFCVTCMPCALYEFTDDDELCRPRFWED